MTTFSLCRLPFVETLADLTHWRCNTVQYTLTTLVLRIERSHGQEKNVRYSCDGHILRSLLPSTFLFMCVIKPFSFISSIDILLINALPDLHGGWFLAFECGAVIARTQKHTCKDTEPTIDRSQQCDTRSGISAGKK